MNIDKQIQAHVETFVRELSALVREAAVESVQRALGGSATRAASHPTPAARRPTRGVKRSPAQIKSNVDAVLAFIKSNPGVRSEVVRTKLKMARPTVQDAINRLRASKKIAMKGAKRAATYRVA